LGHMKRFLLPPIAVMYMALAVHAADPPPLKEGLCSIHTVTTDEPGNKKTEGTRSVCRNHAYDDRVRAQAARKIHSDNYSGLKYESESECVIQGSTVHTKGTATDGGDNGTAQREHHYLQPGFRRNQLDDDNDHGPEVCRTLSCRHGTGRHDGRQRKNHPLCPETAVMPDQPNETLSQLLARRSHG
jgi:hypothetical protein